MPVAITQEAPTPLPKAVAAVKKRLAIRTFPLPPLPPDSNDGPEFRAFTSGVMKQLADGRARVIAASHKIAGEYANANELIYDGGLLKETVTSAQKATFKSTVDCAKLGEYTKNALAALQSLPQKGVNSGSAATDFAQQLPELERLFVTLMFDLHAIQLNLDDLHKNADSANSQYLEDRVQDGLSSVSKLSEDILDLKTSVGNLGSSLRNSTRNL